MNLRSTFGLVVLLTTASLSAVARPASLKVSMPDNNDAGDAFSTPIPDFGSDSGGGDPVAKMEKAEKKWEDEIDKGQDASWFGAPIGDGLGAWAGGPMGGGSTGDIRSTFCTEKGPCYNKKLTCPAKCFKKVSKSGSGFSASAGAGGCSMDCKTCTATC